MHDNQVSRNISGPELIPDTSRKPNKKWLRKLNESKYLLLMFVPCFLYYLLFKYLPMGGIVISFKDYNLHRGIWDSPWVGFRFYEIPQ